MPSACQVLQFVPVSPVNCGSLEEPRLAAWMCGPSKEAVHPQRTSRTQWSNPRQQRQAQPQAKHGQLEQHHHRVRPQEEPQTQQSQQPPSPLSMAGKPRAKQRHEPTWSSLAKVCPPAAHGADGHGRIGNYAERHIIQHHSHDPQELNPDDFRSLKHQLQAVNLEDPATVITVREIKNLIWPGASVEERLQQYFDAYGAVKDVLVPRAAVKHMSNKRKNAVRTQSCRVRSSNVGWIVMSSADPVLEILRDGQHTIDGVSVRVEEFRRSTWDGDAKPAEDDMGESSSGSGRSTCVPEQAQLGCQRWPDQRAPFLGGMVPDISNDLVQCHQLHPWPHVGLDGLVAPTMVPASPWGHVVYAPFPVFSASAEELRNAMPDCYMD